MGHRDGASRAGDRQRQGDGGGGLHRCRGAAGPARCAAGRSGGGAGRDGGDGAIRRRGAGPSAPERQPGDAGAGAAAADRRRPRDSATLRAALAARRRCVGEENGPGAGGLVHAPAGSSPCRSSPCRRPSLPRTFPGSRHTRPSGVPCSSGAATIIGWRAPRSAPMRRRRRRAPTRGNGRPGGAIPIRPAGCCGRAHAVPVPGRRRSAGCSAPGATASDLTGKGARTRHV